MKGRGTPDGRIDRYLSKPRPWRPELRALREILLSEGLDEALADQAPQVADRLEREAQRPLQTEL
mgnify:CR=1 FL=1